MNWSSLVDWVAGISETSPFDELESVKSFEQLQRSIEAVKQMVLADARTEAEAIEGLRMILKHLASSTNDSINTDLRNPLFAKRDPRNRDIGAYNPDAEYDQATIDGRYDYKLSGHVGTVPYLSVTVNGASADKFSELVAYLDDDAIRQHVGPDGGHPVADEGKLKAPGRWILYPTPRTPSSSGSTSQTARATRSRRSRSRPWAIDCPTSRRSAMRRWRSASRTPLPISSWLDVASTLLPRCGRPRTASSAATAIGASAANAENYYQMAYYEIGAGEALAIDFTPPDTVYWNLTSATLWHESIAP